MLTREQAIEAAAGELAHDAELVGEAVGVRAAVEAVHHWVLHPDTVRALESGSSRDSAAYRIPPVVVDRRTGRVTRPVAAGSRVTAADLGDGEWFVAPAVATAGAASFAGAGLSAEAEARAGRLRHFRLQRAGRDSGDLLVASIVAADPASVEPGLRAAGLHPGRPGWTTADGRQVSGSFDAPWATVRLRISGTGPGGDPWTISGADVDLAADIESALADAPWIRFWGP
jgi:hypothetical protein